jgi:GNAT superfamily N-acetyltransferase
MAQVKAVGYIAFRMGSNLTIRRALLNDAYEAAEVFIASQHSMEFFPRLHTDAETHDFVRGFVGRGETWLAERDHEIVGLACIEGDKLAHLYVHPDHHNSGAGSALLDKVKSRRPKGFQLWTFQANDGARRFYERHGCKAVELTDGQNNDEKLPDMRYVWPPT